MIKRRLNIMLIGLVTMYFFLLFAYKGASAKTVNIVKAENTAKTEETAKVETTALKEETILEEEIVAEGVYVDSVHIGGMTLEEAEEAISNYIKELKSKTVTVKVEDETERISADELGFDNKDYDFFEQVIEIGKSGNLIKRYKEIKDIAHNNLVLSLEFTIDKNLIKEFVETNLSVYDVESQNASVKREGGQFVYTDHVVGRRVDVEGTIKSIEDSIINDRDKRSITLDAVVLQDEPKYTREDVEKVDSVLGTYSTNFTSSTASRTSNVAHGAYLINNTLVYPGEEFDANVELSPFTTANGYSIGGAYVNGKVVDSIGGGACQVTTTLYNTALYAEMEITERAAHSMTVGYVDLSRDAAIAGTYKNLRFRNNTDYPILVQGYTQNRAITFTIWGHETRPDNRTIKYETVVLSSKGPPADVVTEDPTQPEGYEKVTQSSHTGYVAELYKVVYENGRQVDRYRVNKSSYNATPRYVTVGTMPEPSPEPTPEPTPEEGVPADGQGEVPPPEGAQPAPPTPEAPPAPPTPEPAAPPTS